MAWKTFKLIKWAYSASQLFDRVTTLASLELGSTTEALPVTLSVENCFNRWQMKECPAHCGQTTLDYIKS